jgi:hypothetical protein
MRKKGRPPIHVFPKVKSTCKLNGAAHGTKVHKQIFKITNGIAKGKKIRPLLRGLDPCTKRIVKVLIDKQWIPISSELMIYDENWRVATAIDLIVLSLSDNKIIAIETKTGYEDEVN